MTLTVPSAVAAPPHVDRGAGSPAETPPVPPPLRTGAEHAEIESPATETSSSEITPSEIAPPATLQDAAATEDDSVEASNDPFRRPPQDLLRSLSEVRVSLDTPASATQAETTFEQRGTMTLAPHAWPTCTPEAACYRFSCAPLWYEDANLERCGHSYGCCQPLVSGAYFFGNTVTLPYRLVSESQCDRVPVKSFCPPGYRYSCVDNYFPEPDPAGGAAEALAITGLIFLIP